MIQFFVSSTFKDMFGERETLHRNVLPRVNELAKKYGEYVECTDLRWGLDTDHMGKILGVCLSQIKNPCRYNMIIFLGDYYGTVPAEDTGDKNSVLAEIELIRSEWRKAVHDDEGDELPDYNISVTQLELEYGLLRQGIRAKSPARICLIRKLHDGKRMDYGQKKENTTKQETLIDRVRKEKGGNTFVEEYDADWQTDLNEAVDLRQMEDILVDRIEMILKERSRDKKNQNWVETAQLESETFRAQLTQHFRGREELKQHIVKEIHKKSVHTVCVYGPSASGKSSILSKVYEECESETKYFIACGHTTRSRTYLDVLLQMIYFVEVNLNEDSEEKVKIRNFYSEEKAEQVFLDVVKQYNSTDKKEILIFVDALDKLRAFGSERISQLLVEAGKVTIICSMMTEHPGEVQEGVSFVKISELTEHDMDEIVSGNMVVAEHYTKEIEKILYERQQARNPLYITSGISILQMHLNDVQGKNYDEMYMHFRDLVRKFPEELSDLCWETIKATGKYLEFSGYELVCGMIAATENGLRSTDLEKIFERYDSVKDKNHEWKFDLFRAYLDKNLYFRIQENGCWTFGHDLIKAGVRKKLCDTMYIYKDKLWDYLQTMPELDEVKIEEGLLLCSEKNEYEFAKQIFEEYLRKAENSSESKEDRESNKKEATLIIQTLYTIVSEKGRKEWYLRLADKYPFTVLKILESGLRYDSGPEYERRYPAKELADLFWLNRHCDAEILCDTLDQIQEDEQLPYCAACAEYVGIYDDISKQENAFIYELPVYEYVCRRVKFNMLSEKNKARIYKAVNLVFYSNNKIINGVRKGKIKRDLINGDAGRIGQDFINWYKDNIEDPDDRFSGREDTEGKFVNNIGQFYEAVGKYEGAYIYRVRALRIKAAVLLNEEKDPNGIWKNKFDEILRGDNISVEEHTRFWREIKENIPLESPGKTWNQIAVSYRTLATDCYYLADTAECKEEKLREAVGFHTLCLNMQKEPFVEKVQKETAVTYNRKAGTYVKLYSMLSDSEKDEIIPFMQEAAVWIKRYAYQDEREQKIFRDNLQQLIELFEKDGKTCTELRQIV